ncbi:MAG TPA: HAMP domain-containing sensor histidine kinase [Kofleriaceae bacterium]|nr:HAMP domain-containing sensor histidine kinase [Kofleriaceae bacterium]
MTTSVPDAMPALLDALDRANIGYAVFRYVDGGFLKETANDVAQRQLNYTLEEWRTQPMLNLVSATQREHVMSLFYRIVKSDPLPAAVELFFTRRDGTILPVDATFGRTNDERGVAVVLLWTDREFTTNRMSLLEADRIALVAALAAGFAHETNNPLTSVLLNLRSLRKQLVMHLSDAKQTAALRVLDDITAGAERIASNVRAFQTLASRSEAKPIDLAAVTSAVLRLALPTLESRAHVVRQIFPVTTVSGEEARVGQAVLAMLLFSCSGFDGTAPDARIVVAVEERDNWVIVEVSDNGPELPADEAQHAFDPFFRSQVRGAGFGVGLTVARSVASTLGGDVAMTPRPGGGTVITLRLPPTPKTPPTT